MSREDVGRVGGLRVVVAACALSLVVEGLVGGNSVDEGADAIDPGRRGRGDLEDGVDVGAHLGDEGRDVRDVVVVEIWRGPEGRGLGQSLDLGVDDAERSFAQFNDIGGDEPRPCAPARA